MRAGDWKLIEFFEDHRLELYNLQDDIGERHNLAAEQPQKAAELNRRLQAWRSSVGADATPNPNRKAEIPGQDNALARALRTIEAAHAARRNQVFPWIRHWR